MLTNKARRFQRSCVIETGLSDFHKMTITALKSNRFCQICTDTLNKYAGRKKKAIRRNHSLFINKDIAKAIMKRARFRNIYFKLRTIESKLAYAKPRNYCVTFIRKGKKKGILWQSGC